MAERSLPDRVLAYLEQEPPQLVSAVLLLADAIEVDRRRLDDLEQQHRLPDGSAEQTRVVPPIQGET